MVKQIKRRLIGFEMLVDRACMSRSGRLFGIGQESVEDKIRQFGGDSPTGGAYKGDSGTSQ